jgi:signal transduction histidine kinase
MKELNKTNLIFSPIASSDEIIGTYEMSISIPHEQISHEEQIKLVLLSSFIGIIIIIVSLLYVLRRIIVNPIIDFKNKSKNIAKGELDTRIEIKSNDEIGELSNAFNQMAISLKESINQIENYNKNLRESKDKIQYYNLVLKKILNQKDEFIGQLGHDLKNPLQPLIGLLPILINKEENPGKKETLEVMYQNALIIQNLISDTLKLAKLRSDNIEFKFEKLNLNEEVEKTISSQKIKFIENNIKIENSIDEDIIVWADQIRLYEVFQNLISNSVKYMSKERGIIELNAEKINNEVKVIVRDNGVGMTQDQVKRIFDEFYKADQKTSDYHSTGLGLSICKRIIEKHGGKIWAESPGLGKGSTFNFTLKIAN